MSDAKLVTPELWHAEALVEHMAPRDIMEFAMLGISDPVERICRGIENSVCGWTALEGDDEPLCIGGVGPGAGIGVLWMVSQPGLERHKKFFLRESRARLPELLERFPRLITIVSCEYTKSLRWLEWLGFDVSQEIAVRGRPLRKVTL